MQASAPIAGDPYSATMTTTTTILDSEGKSIDTSRQRTLVWRDSAGRVREEEMMPAIPNHMDAFGLITAVDTVHHCQFNWNAPVPRGQAREAVVNSIREK